MLPGSGTTVVSLSILLQKSWKSCDGAGVDKDKRKAIYQNMVEYAWTKKKSSSIESVLRTCIVVFNYSILFNIIHIHNIYSRLLVLLCLYCHTHGLQKRVLHVLRHERQVEQTKNIARKVNLCKNYPNLLTFFIAHVKLCVCMQQMQLPKLWFEQSTVSEENVKKASANGSRVAHTRYFHWIRKTTCKLRK